MPMATNMNALEQLFLCKACSRTLVDPVTLACGHSFCRADLAGLVGGICPSGECSVRITKTSSSLGTTSILRDALQFLSYIKQADTEFVELRKIRTELASATGAPAYIIATDAMLRGIVAASPRNLSGVQKVAGFGASRCAKYGTAFLAALLPPGSTNMGPQIGIQATPVPAAASSSTTKRRRESDSTAVPKTLNSHEERLFQALRSRRLEIARSKGLAPFIIAHDSMLRNITMHRPTSLAAMAEIRGMGPARCAAYGEPFLDAMRKASHS
jgi:superfamily II DNA helicase RecQ